MPSRWITLSTLRSASSTAGCADSFRPGSTRDVEDALRQGIEVERLDDIIIRPVLTALRVISSWPKAVNTITFGLWGISVWRRRSSTPRPSTFGMTMSSSRTSTWFSLTNLMARRPSCATPTTFNRGQFSKIIHQQTAEFDVIVGDHHLDLRFHRRGRSLARISLRPTSLRVEQFLPRQDPVRFGRCIVRPDTGGRLTSL